MNINEIKTQLGYEQLNLNTAIDSDNKPTDWFRHWDNDNRVAVSLHKDTFKAIKEGNPSTLGLQSEMRTGAKGEYKSMRIVLFTPAEEIL